jgi:hypothetical protein
LLYLDVGVGSSVASLVAWLGRNTVDALTVGRKIFPEEGQTVRNNYGKEKHKDNEE